MASASEPPPAGPEPPESAESAPPVDAESVRLRILRGARKVFARLGFAQTSVEAILEEARVSRRTFYRTFHNKEEVLGELFANSVDMLIKAVARANREHVSSSQLERMVAGIDAYIRVHEQAGPLARVLLLEQFSPGSSMASHRAAGMAAFTDMIARGMSLAGRQPIDPIVIRAVVAGINQVAVQMATEYPEGGWDVPRAKRAMLRLLAVLDERNDPANWLPGS
jgi:AcrR family transcriptional regulator